MTMSFLSWLDVAGVVVFAISGALTAEKKSMDLFGALVVGFVTALGGGTLRDLMLNKTPSWVFNGVYPSLTALAVLGTALWLRWLGTIRPQNLLVADAIGLAVFTVNGTEIALQAGTPMITAMLMGAMTGAAGGVIRDIICNEIPLIFKTEIYATACMAGSLVLILAKRLDMPHAVGLCMAMATVFLLRVAALRWKLALPKLRAL